MIPKHPFKWRHFQGEIILLCVRWYLRYPLSYRNLEEMNMIRKGQVQGVAKGDIRAQVGFVSQIFGVAA
jgi:hypothetical protein